MKSPALPKCRGLVACPIALIVEKTYHKDMHAPGWTVLPYRVPALVLPVFAVGSIVLGSANTAEPSSLTLSFKLISPLAQVQTCPPLEAPTGPSVTVSTEVDLRIHCHADGQQRVRFGRGAEGGLHHRPGGAETLPTVNHALIDPCPWLEKSGRDYAVSSGFWGRFVGWLYEMFLPLILR